MHQRVTTITFETHSTSTKNNMASFQTSEQHEQYGLQLCTHRRALKHPMSKMVCEVARGAGIHSIINDGIYSVDHHVSETRDTSEMRVSLQKASSEAGFELTPIQIETISNTVWRPTSRATVSYRVHRGNSPEITVNRTFDSPITDTGSPVFMDLPPGMGKTIVSSIASLIMSLERHDEVTRQKEYSTNKGFIEVVDKAPNGGRVSMIFCPKHVHHQWMFAAKKAVEILSLMYTTKTLRVESNKMASSIDSSAVDAALIVCDSSAFSLTRALESDVVYGCLCFDECTENCDVTNNAVFSLIPNGLMYGRLVLISADFSKIGDYSSKVGSSRKGSMIRRVFGESNTAEMSHAVVRAVDRPVFYTHGNATVRRAASVVACLTMNSVFPADRREDVVNSSAELLSDVTLYTFGVKYKRSIFERMGSSAAFDLTPMNGNDRFMDAVGVDITGCTSIEEILARVEANRVTVNNRINRRAVRALEVLREVVHEDCIVCLDKMNQASIIQPCFHVVCRECLPYLEASGKCPMCRGVIRGAVTSDVVGKRTFQEAFDAETSSKAENSGVAQVAQVAQVTGEILPVGEEFTKAILTRIPVNDGSLSMQATMGHVLESLSVAHERSGGGTFRVVVVCSQVDLNTTGFSSIGYEMIRYRAKGTSRFPVTRKKLVKQLDSFQADDGKKKIMLVHDETSGSGSNMGHYRSGRDDNITGMDFPKLEAVVSIGSENRAQRVGRLCRMSRLFMEKEKRDAIYIELSGV